MMGLTPVADCFRVIVQSSTCMKVRIFDLRITRIYGCTTERYEYCLSVRRLLGKERSAIPREIQRSVRLPNVKGPSFDQPTGDHPKVDYIMRTHGGSCAAAPLSQRDRKATYTYARCSLVEYRSLKFWIITHIAQIDRSRSEWRS